MNDRGVSWSLEMVGGAIIVVFIVIVSMLLTRAYAGDASGLTQCESQEGFSIFSTDSFECTPEADKGGLFCIGRNGCGEGNVCCRVTGDEG